MAFWRRISSRGMLVALAVVMSLAIWPAHSVAATQVSTFVFFEKFTPDNPHQWDVRKLTDGSQTFLAGGGYHLVRTRAGTMRGWPLKVTVPRGFQFNVKLQITRGSDPYAGVTFWDDLGNNFMLFVITPDGRAGLFAHTAKGYKSLVDWHTEAAIHKGIQAINSLGVNLDAVSAAEGRTLLINGVPLGKACKDIWHAALGQMPTPPAWGYRVGVLSGSYKGLTEVTVQRASMYDGSKLSPAQPCP